MNDNGEMFADFCFFNKLVIRGKRFSTQEGTLGDLGFSRQQDRESDRPHLCIIQVQEVTARFQREERSRCRFRPSPSYGQMPSEAEEL